jgi:hypothetical protein
MDEVLRIAHVDESGFRLDKDQRLYVVAASITVSSDASVIDQGLRDLLLPGRRYLHHYDETLDRRLKIAGCLAGLPLTGALVVVARCDEKAQEDARRRLLSRLLPTLQHMEAVDRVIIESRGGSDKSDRRTISRLRRSRHLTSDLRADHAPKAADPLLWVADFVAGSWVGAQYRDEVEPWRVLDEAHAIEVIQQT